MLIILILFFSGIFIGHFFKNNKKLIKSSESSLGISVFLLLVLLGILVGKNQKLISSISGLGFKAFIITLFAMLFSIFFAYIFYRFNSYDR